MGFRSKALCLVIIACVISSTAVAQVCSTEGDPSVCLPPLKQALGAFTDMGAQVGLTDVDGENKAYAYLTADAYGACKVIYLGGKYNCEPQQDKKAIKQSISGIEKLGVSNVKYIIVYTFDDSAILQINRNTDADAAARFIQSHFNDFSQYDGVLLDFGSNPNPANGSDYSLMNTNGQALAEAVSLYIPHNKMLNVAAGIPGFLIPNADADKGTYAYKYQWQFWSAINRANVDCTAASHCQLGNYIYPLYNKSIDWYPFISTTQNGTKLNVAFNLGVRQFPFQMRLLSEFVAEVNGYEYPFNSVDPSRTVKFAIKPISVNGGEIGGPGKKFGYYQIGVMASGSNLVDMTAEGKPELLYGTSSGYATFNSTAAFSTLTNSQDYWGENNAKSMPALPAVTMTYSESSCGGKFKDIKGCASYRQVMAIPEPYKSHGAGENYLASDILNQYVCTQLNAITYTFSSGVSIAQPPYFCGIGYQKDQTTGHTAYRVLNFSDVTNRISSSNNLVFPYRQAGYQAMTAAVIYRVNNSAERSQLLNYCYDQAKAGSIIPNQCILIPQFGTVWDGPNNSTWSMIINWAETNFSADKPAGYIANLPGYSLDAKASDSSKLKEVEQLIGDITLP